MIDDTDGVSLNWEDLDDDYELFNVGDTADLSGIVTITDDGYYDGIDYVFPVQDEEPEPEPDLEQEEVSLAVISRNQLPTRVPKHSLADAYQISDDDDEGSWAPIILGIVVALAMIGGLLWLILNSDSCSRQQETVNPPAQEQTEPEDEDEDEKENTTPVTPVTPVTPTTNDDDKKDEQKEPEKQEEQKEPEKQDEQKEEETAQPVWVPEKGHYENKWVVDKEAYDEPVYSQVERIIHHESEWVVDQEAWSEQVTDDEGNVIDTIYHPEEGHYTDPWDEYTGEYDWVQTGTRHHNEEGHFEDNWIVDEPGHWEYPDAN